LIASKPQFLKAICHVGMLHEAAPQEAGAIVFYHHGDGALVYCDVGRGEPDGTGAEGVVESVLAPETVAVNVVELLHGGYALVRGVWH